MPVERVIRKVSRTAELPLDEQPWLVQLVLGVWAVLLIAVVIAQGGFDDPQFFRNGIVRLCVVATAWAGIAWYVSQRKGLIGRRMRFAVACSLVAHTLIAILLIVWRLQLLEVVLPEDVTIVEVEPIEQPRVVEVNRPQPTERPTYEKPVPTEQLAAQTPKVTREQTEPAEVQPNETVEPSPTELAETPAPNLQAVPREATPMAHRAVAAGKRSRQLEAAQMAAESAAALAQASAPAAAAPLAASTAEPTPASSLARADTSEDQPSSQAAPPAGETSNAEPTRIARNRQRSEPNISRSIRRERQTNAAQLAATNPTQRIESTTPSQVARKETPQPTRGTLARQSPELSQDKTVSADVRLPQPDAPTEMAKRSTSLPDVQLARSPRKETQRGPVELAAPSEQKLETKVETPTATLASERPADRTPTSLPKSTMLDVATDTTAVEMESTQANATSVARSETSVAESLRSETQGRSRSIDAAALAKAAAQLLEQGRLDVARPSPLPEATSPAAHALADTRGGTASPGDGMNSADDSPAAPTYMAPVAAAAAERSRSSQTRTGSDLAPVPMARQQRGRASAAMASSAMRAEQIENAKVAGTSNPQEASASSSAARVQQFANVSLGDINAAAGEATVDTGPPTITPRSGSGRGQRGGRTAALADAARGGVPKAGGGSAAGSSGQVAGTSGTGQQIGSSAGSTSGSQTVAARTRSIAGGSINSGPGSRSTTNTRRLRLANAAPGLASGGGEIEPIASNPGPASGGVAMSAPTPGAGATGQPNQAAFSGRFAGGGSSSGPSDPAGVNGLPATGGLANAGRAPMVTGTRGTGRAGSESGESIAGAKPGQSGRPGVGLATAMAMARPAVVALLPPMVDGNGNGGGSGDSPQPAPSTPASGNTGGRGIARQPLDVDLTPGVGGLLDLPATDPGLPSRFARADSTIPSLSPSRFVGSSPRSATGAGRERRPAPAFAARGLRKQELLSGGSDSPTPTSEEAIELGLKFLAGAQKADGRWSLDYIGDQPLPKGELYNMQADAAATGLSLLAFLGAGYDHFDGPYRETVAGGLKFLVESQQDSGLLMVDGDQKSNQATKYYGHGIATLALCEAYGMTGDPKLLDAAQKAIDFITNTQHKRLGGWRYQPGVESDLSVTGWQMMALRSGELAGLEVDRNTYRRVRNFLELCREKDGDQARFCYNPESRGARLDEQSRWRQPSTVMTSVGLLVQLYLGEGRDSQRAQLGADELLRNLPKHGEGKEIARSNTNENPLRDTYYWYYGTQVMFHMRGEYWKQWHEALHPLLVENQTKEGPLAGSWSPVAPAPDRWHHMGRLYVTTMNLLSLEVSYRHLPLYEMTGD